MIFNIVFRAHLSLICSVSDDRSIRLWLVSHPNRPPHPWTPTQWQVAKFDLSHVLFGHSARVWDCVLLKEHVVSVGEDATCIVWDYSGNITSKYKGHKVTSINR